MKYVWLLGLCSLIVPTAFAQEGGSPVGDAHQKICLTGSVVCPKESADPYAWPAPAGLDPRCTVTPEIIAIRRTGNPAQIQTYDVYLTKAGCPGMFKPPVAPSVDRFASIPEPKPAGDRSPASSQVNDPQELIERHDDPRPPDDHH